MKEVRDLVYISYDKELKRVISYGIEFKEFIQALSIRPNNILVLKGYYGTGFNYTTNCEYCTKEDIDEFIEEDVYSYGDFSWIDFETNEGLEELSKQEVAELFYIGKMWTPVNSTYFEKLNNRFVYTAHDDGWLNHIYYNFKSDYKEVISNIIVNKIDTMYNLKIPPIDEVIEEICELSEKGIAIDLFRLTHDDDGAITVPIYQLGNYSDMDKVYELTREMDIQVNYEIRYKTKWLLNENP